jgi:glycosyltransferase involved in cell wall biosynthesis
MLVGISLVRNEEDLVATAIRHHLRQGLDLILIADNDSTDGTVRCLERLAAMDRRIVWSRTGDIGFRQSAAVTELAREAVVRGASWILPFDADEFWYAPSGLAAELRDCRADAVSVEVVNFIQAREQIRREPGAVLNAVYRCGSPIGDYRKVRHLVDAGTISYVEASYQRKYISRAIAGIEIGPGNHLIKGVGSKRLRSRRLACLHLPLRAREIFFDKAEQAARLEAAGLPLWHGWQSHRFAKAVREGWIEAEWAANSQLGGELDTVRGKVQLAYDPRLRDLLRATLEQP